VGGDRVGGKMLLVVGVNRGKGVVVEVEVAEGRRREEEEDGG
jgi:hypothetical protein